MEEGVLGWNAPGTVWVFNGIVEDVNLDEMVVATIPCRVHFDVEMKKVDLVSLDLTGVLSGHLCRHLCGLGLEMEVDAQQRLCGGV